VNLNQPQGDLFVLAFGPQFVVPEAGTGAAGKFLDVGSVLSLAGLSN